MKDVTIYIKPTCPYCKKALLVLNRYGVTPNIIDLTTEPARRQEMITRAGRSTVPQIFFGDNHIGGSDDLVKIEKSGQLKERIK